MKILDVPRSGSYQGVTSSRNRFGQYVRTRATPVNPASTFQGAVRSRLANNAAAWRGITSTQRAGWTALGLNITRTDSLGQTYTLNGFMAYCLVNNNNAAAGVSLVSDAPELVDPGTLLTATITLSSSVFSVGYTATPLGTGVKLFTFCSPQKSAGRNFNQDYRLIAVSAAAAASPANIFSAYQARLGTPVSGQKVFISLALYQGGFMGSPLLVAATVA